MSQIRGGSTSQALKSSGGCVLVTEFFSFDPLTSKCWRAEWVCLNQLIGFDESTKIWLALGAPRKCCLLNAVLNPDTP